jgi:hypothetical protein
MAGNNNQPQESVCDEPEIFCKMSEEEIDYNVMASFPASDPPCWTLGIRLNKQPREDFQGEKSSVIDPSHQNEPPSINASRSAEEASE